jgi:RNA polymerase sigma-70 factor (ECF subfamily)
VQEAFVRLIRSRDSYNPAKPFSVWFFTILRNVCLGMIRRQGLEAEAMQAMAVEPVSPAEPAVTDPADIEGLLATLPRIEREALTLRIMHDLSFADVGAALGIGEAAAKKRAQRAIGRLRDRMSKEGLDGPILDPFAAAV